MRRSEASFTSFSHHAYDRVEERLTMPREELGERLKSASDFKHFLTLTANEFSLNFE